MKFDPKEKHKLDSRERKKILPPYELLTELGPGEGDVLLDIGCGTGFFSMPASYMVGNKGKVYGMDISEEMLDTLREKLNQEEKLVDNIESKKSTTYNFPLADKSVSHVLLSNVLHEVEDKKRLLLEVYRVMKDGGALLIIEWQKKETEQGPPYNIRLSKEEVENYISKAGLKLKKTFSQSDMFNVFRANK